MNKQIIIIIGMVLLINLVGAIDIYAGDSYTFPVEEQYDYYSIVGNITPIDLIVEQEGLNITITFNKYQQEDTFELIFFNKEKETITIYQSSGGGGGTRTIYKDKNITQYVDKEVEVEKIVEVEDEEEINRLLEIANDALKGENRWKILFVVAISIITIMMIIKIKNLYKKE